MSKIDLYKGDCNLCVLCENDYKSCEENPYLDEAIDDIVCRKFKLTKIKTAKKRIEDTVVDKGFIKSEGLKG